MAALIKEVTDRQALRILYSVSTGKDSFEDRDGKTFFAEEYIWWLEDKVFKNAQKSAADILEGVRERAPNIARDEICAHSMESDNICEYCIKKDIGNCTWCGIGRPMFKGRKLSPVA